MMMRKTLPEDPVRSVECINMLIELSLGLELSFLLGLLSLKLNHYFSLEYKDRYYHIFTRVVVS
jgi:hypothetical protein